MTVGGVKIGYLYLKSINMEDNILKYVRIVPTNYLKENTIQF